MVMGDVAIHSPGRPTGRDLSPACVRPLRAMLPVDGDDDALLRIDTRCGEK